MAATPRAWDPDDRVSPAGRSARSRQRQRAVSPSRASDRNVQHSEEDERRFYEQYQRRPGIL